MDSLKGALTRPARVPLPDSAFCERCGNVVMTDPETVRIIKEHDPSGHALIMGRCKCAVLAQSEEDKTAWRAQEANLPHEDGEHRTFLNLKEKPGTLPMMAAAREFLSGTGPRVLVLTGEIGMGKSHLAEAIGRMLLRTGRTVRWDKTSDLLEKLRHTQSFESTETLHSVLETYRRYYCLILDDIGVRGQETEWAIDKLTALIDRRMENGQWLVITTNRNRDQMAQAVGPRLADRLFSTNPSLNDVRIVVCSGQSYRR